MMVGGGEEELLEVAWLYHVGQLSQEEVSRRLGVSRFKVLRLLAEARERGLVRVTIEHRTRATLELAERVASRWGLREVQVAPVPEGADDDHARRAVGIVAAGLLARLGSGGERTIGLGWGRTVAAMADALVGLRNPRLRFVSLMGTMTRVSGTGPFDVTARLAAATGGTALVLPAPFLCDSEEDTRVVLRQRLVRETLEVARSADHAIVSVGECNAKSLLVSGGILSKEDADALVASQAVADTTGKFFQINGRLAETDLNSRTPSIALHDLLAMDVTLLAAGRLKAAATRAVLQAGIVNRLVADERLAWAMMVDV
jgi:DNA-binding transcriptional regulator LsrR (DeoR family)